MRSDEEVLRLLTLACDHLDMETAFVSELTDTHQLYRAIAGDDSSFGLHIGRGPRREDTFCDLMVAGQLPKVIADTSAEARVAHLSATREAAIGAYVGVPLTLPDGRLYGTLCCLSHRPDPRLDDRDGKFLELIAGMIAGRVGAMEAVRVDHAEVAGVIDSGSVDIALQPILCLTTGKYRGAEALARFPGSSRRVDEMFALAAAAGLGPDLELLALRRALEHLDDVPADAYLSVNMSPEGIADPRFVSLMRRCGELHRVVLEVTEHAPVEWYAALHEVLQPLRDAGMRLAVDDVGSGYASFRHVLQLRPDIIKIDRSLVDGISADPALRTIAGNIVLLGLDLRAAVVAEGVETAQDLEILETLGADMAQGYLFARPSTSPVDWRSWAAVAPRAAGTAPAVTDTPVSPSRSQTTGTESPADSAGREFSRCARAVTFQQACDLVTGDLVDCGFTRPSVYVLAGRILRCVSARGYFQVVDGLELGDGIIGRVAATGHALLIDDVSADPDFITADPGIRSEAAVPVCVDGRIVAVVNVESATVLPAATLTILGAAAASLGAWTAAHGGAPTVEPQDEMVRACRDIAAFRYAGPVRRRALAAAVELSGMSSAMIVQFSVDDLTPSVADAVGPLADVVRGWSACELRAMAAWVRRGTSSHDAAGDTGPCHAFLEQAGVGALAVHPLTCEQVTWGLLIVLDRRRPSRTQPSQRALVEQLVASTAMALRTATGEEPPRALRDDVNLDRPALIEQWWRRLSGAQRELARSARGGPLSAGLLQSLRDAGLQVLAYASAGVSGDLAQCWMPRDVAQYIDSLTPADQPPARVARVGKPRRYHDHSPS